MEPSIPPNHFATYVLEPVKVLTYTRPKLMRVLVPGKPMNRAYRRAEASFNKKALKPPLQTSPETATPETPPKQESQS